MKKLLVLSAMLCACVIQLAVAKDKPAASRSGLINSAAVDKSIKPKEFGSFAVGTIGDQKTWQAFATKAGLPKNVIVDWKRQVVLYVILKVNSNSISFRKWIEPKKGTGELVFNWSLIEPDHGDRYPALVHVADRADLKSVQFSYRTDVGEVEERLQKLGTIDLKQPPVKEQTATTSKLFGEDENNMELRGGLWYVKGQAKPFSGKVSRRIPAHGNEIARFLITTYVNGKKQDSKVDIFIGKQAPRPNR